MGYQMPDIITKLQASGFAIVRLNSRVCWVFLDGSNGTDGVYVTVEGLEREHQTGTLVEYVRDTWEGRGHYGQ